MVRNGILYSDLVETSIEQYGKERDIKQLNKNMKEHQTRQKHPPP